MTDPIAAARALIEPERHLATAFRFVPGTNHISHTEEIESVAASEYEIVAKLVATLADALGAERARADKAEDERDQALARLAAAYEAAACVTVDMGPRYDGRSVHYHIPEMAKGVIRDLTPADAQAALDKMLDAAWNEAVEASAFSFENNTSPRKTRQTILALKRPETDHE